MLLVIVRTSHKVFNVVCHEVYSDATGYSVCIVYICDKQSHWVHLHGGCVNHFQLLIAD